MKTHHKLIIINSLVQLTGRLVSAGLMFVATLLLARTLGSNYFGEFSKATAYLAIFYVLVDLGMNQIFLKFYKLQLKSKFLHLLSLRVIISLMLMVVAGLGALILSFFSTGYSDLMVQAVFLGSSSIVGYAVYLTSVTVFQAYLVYQKAMAAQILGSIVALGLLSGFYRIIKTNPHNGVLLANLIMAIGTITTGLIALKLTQAYIGKINLQKNYLIWKKILAASLPLGWVLLVNAFYLRSGLLVLAAFKSSHEVGIYGLALKFFELAVALPTFVMNSIYPVWLDQKLNKQVLLQHVFNINKIMFWFSIAVSLILWFGAPMIVLLKTDYFEMIGLLRITAFLLPVFYLTSPLIWLFVIIQKQHQLVLIYTSAAVVNFLINLMIIPDFSYRGAIMSLLVSEAMVLFWGYRVLFSTKEAKEDYRSG